MNDFKVSLTKIPTKQPLNSKELAFIDSIIAEDAVTISRDSFRSFAEMVGNKGHTFCPVTFNDGVKSKETYEQSRLLPLYFDSRDTTFEDIKSRADRYDLPIAFAYDTFSIGSRRRFTAIFMTDTALSEPKDAETVRKALMAVFPEADKACADVTKLYHGGNKLLFCDDTAPVVDVDSLLMSTSLCLSKRHGVTNYKRKLTELSKTTGLRLDERGLPNVFVQTETAEDSRDVIGSNCNDDKNSPISTMRVYSFGEKLSNRTNGTEATVVHVDRVKSAIHRSYRSSDLKYLSGCQLYREFESGERKLSQRELLGLATNLIRAETGDKRFKAVLSDNAYFSDQPEKYSNWDYYFYYIKGRPAKPCSVYCPHHAECPHSGDIWSTVKPRYHKIERIANYHEPLCSPEEAWEDFMENFLSAVKSNKKIWHVIKSQTALGKTQAILEFLKNTGLKILIAVPTNKLKREIRERAKKMGIEITVSPSLHELEKEMPEYVWEHIKALQDSGRSVIPFLLRTTDEGGECAEVFKRYLQELDDFNNADGHAITTHRRFSMMDVRKYDLAIVDEDIIMSTVITNKVTVDIFDVKKLWKWLKKNKANSLLATKVRKILKHITDSNGETSYFSARKIPFVRAYDAIPMGVDIASICSATEFCCRKESYSESGQPEHYLSFMNPVEFRKDTKYIMLSATANENICEHYFGANNVMFYDCLKGRNEGTINLIYDRSMSRADINKDSDIIGRIQKWSGFEHGISFIKFKDVLEKHYRDCMTYGSCAGRDHFKGKNIDVIGTPHQPDWIYKLFARSLKLEFDPDERIKNRKVEHNGFRFWFATFENEYLRDIQFYIIESELEQAVGRARSLRCKCIVNLYSNFPISQVNLMKADYDNHAGANGTVEAER